MLGKYLAQRFLHQLAVNFTAGQGGIGAQAGQAAFQLADVAFHALGDHLEHIVAAVHHFGLCALAQDGDARFQVRTLDIGDQAPLKTAAQAESRVGDGHWR